MILLDGKKTAADIKEEIALEVRALKDIWSKNTSLSSYYCWKQRSKHYLRKRKGKSL